MRVVTPPDTNNLIRDLDPVRLVRILQNADDTRDERRYLHWDKLRHLKPPEGLTHEEWWLQIKMSRRTNHREIPLETADGLRFTFTLPDAVLRILHLVDQRSAGEIAMEEVVTSDVQARQHYLVNSLMEEAIRSSQLEGATTSRRVAKELLRTQRPPKDRSERMILNNYRALQFMRSVGDRLTPEAVLELHGIVTEGTLDNPDAAGRLQRPGEERVAVVDMEGKVLHTPPPAEQLPARLEALCAFANGDKANGSFIHPVIRGTLLHFWLAYDHPFEDGNGRTARALFYWFMRTRGYWLVEYLSISRILRNAPAQYGKSFLLTETDERDTTYFLLYQLQVVERAISELHEYLKRKMAEIREVERLIKGAAGFNHRQLALLGDALRNPNRIYTFGGHANSHSVTHETARTDLGQLESRGLLVRRQVGRRYSFVVPDEFADRLQELA
ncbi:MAG: Fic family protein [Actinomycetota bacterium]|nr:Fic family protein [Actinomycetota bacterium]